MNQPAPKRSEAEWQPIVQRYRESGLSVSQFARQHGLKISTLGRWVSRFSGVSFTPSKPRLLQVIAKSPPAESATPSKAQGFMLLEVGAFRLRIDAHFDRVLLLDILRTLREASA